MASALETKARMPATERRELIATEAGKLFGRHGYAATRLDDVAKAAGVTKPIVYRHFESKKELYIALLKRHEKDLPGFIQDIEVPGDADVTERVAIILDGWLDYAHANSYSWLIIFRDSTGDPEIEAARAHVNRRAHEILAAFLSEMSPALDSRLVEPTAEFLSRGLAGLVLWWIDNPRVSKAIVHAAATRACAALLAQ